MKQTGFFMLLFLLAAGCGEPVARVGDFGDLEPTRCKGAMAQVAVYDNGLQPLCGCAEGALAAATSSITCTVPVGTMVFFHYTVLKSPHQIVSTGSPSFVSSPVNDPLSTGSARSFAFRFETAGTYAFQDAFNAVINGRIVAQ